MAERPADRSSAQRRLDAHGWRRGTLVDSLPSTPAAPRTGANRRNQPPQPRDAWDAPGTSGAYAPPPARYADEYDTLHQYPEDATYQGGFADEFTDQGYAEQYANEGFADAGFADEYADDWRYESRSRNRSLARPLAPALPHYNHPDDLPTANYPMLPDHSVPELAAYRPMRVPQRVRLNTRALVERARSPWSMVRMALAITALLLALFYGSGRMGENAQPLMVAHAEAGATAGSAVTALVRPETQLLRPDLYDSYSQFQDWGGAACSAAALSETLTAYGVPDATIGHEIDELGSYISPHGGLLNRHGFAVVAAKHNLRADESTSLTYNQLVYLTETLGMPVIVNVRISYGYYHFFDGGHFLTVVGGDAQGLKIVDSSEYYLHYLPKDVFYQMFTGYTAAIVPADYQYTLPNN